VIEIRIDEEACVGCTLCVDVCPTKVFEFDEAKAVPRVVKPKECFGCLSCSEICPATAISHEGADRSENHYYDPGALELASKTTRDVDPVNFPTDPGVRARAVGDLGIRLLSLASVFRQTLGGSLPAVGTMAGRTLANQLPRYQAPSTFQEALDLVLAQLSPTWSISAGYDGAEKLDLEVRDCFIRELCMKEGIHLGGDLCVLFYNYFAGYLGRMSGTRLKLEQSTPGEKTCAYAVKVFRKE
jgi:ferredoxin